MFKAKRSGKDSAHVVVVLDESSSMNSCKAETVAGVNAFLHKQRESAIPTQVSIVTFNGSEVKTQVDRADASSIAALTDASYRPSGMTNLFDAIGRTIHEINEQLAAVKKSERPHVEICIVTDGEENASQLYTQPRIVEMKQACEAKDWTFTFVGARIDAFVEGAKLGFTKTNTYQFTAENMASTMNTMAVRTEAVKLGRTRGLDTRAVYASAELTDAERAKLTQ